ncbi:hypothetical protein K4F52_002722 [Lecanicillium sp. MT-2017a]|nr:hypothetical protein K4F52_002722 [Lecanicillium sp. MT-2017a]
MSLPTTKATQSSIRSFFQPPKAPKYASPPSQASQKAAPSPPPAPPAPPAQPPAPSPQAEPATSLTIPTPPPPTNIPSEATIRPIQEQDIPALRRINALLLPVAFHDALYQTALDSHTSGPFSRVITWAHEGQEAKVVGSIIAILEPAPTSGFGGARVPQNLYIRSLSLLSPYRSLGLANAALEHVVASALSASHLDVRTVTAHVWTENDEGLHWYESRGFERDDYPIQGYYLKLRPGSAWLVQRPIQASVASSLPSAANAASAARQPAPSTTAAIVNLPPMSSTGTATPPPPPPSSKPKGQSFQNQRSETEWNDLPADMMGPGPALLGPPGRKLANGNGVGSEPGSSGSSRSSSVAGMKKKRDRSYPAAAFGS